MMVAFLQIIAQRDESLEQTIKDAAGTSKILSLHVEKIERLEVELSEKRKTMGQAPLLTPTPLQCTVQPQPQPHCHPL